MTTYREFVESNQRWYRGRLPETAESLDDAEAKLGVKFPGDLRWLLSEYGYWHATGVTALDETVDHTLQARVHLGLPTNFVVLADHGDGGAYILDCEPDRDSGAHVVWGTAWEDVPDNLEAGTRFGSLQEYGEYMIETEESILTEEAIDYDSNDFPEGRVGRSSGS